MRRWMIASENENHKILHFNDDSLEQYNKLKRIPFWIMWLLNKFAYHTNDTNVLVGEKDG